MDNNIDWILLILFSLPCPSKSDIIYSKSLYKDLVAIITTILSHISLLRMTTILNYFIRNLTLAMILVTNFSNLLGLLIFGYMKSS